jgi:peptidoglycan/LPS O-acetylase OafA/YrhL
MGVVWLQWRATGTVDWSFGSLRGMAIDTLVHIPMLHGLHPDFDYRGGNGAFWTLAREEYFYLAYFPLLWLRRRLGVSLTVFSVGLVGATLPLLWPSVVDALALQGEARKIALFSLNAENSALALWIQWALGMIAVEAFCERRTLPAWARGAGASMAWLVLAIASRELSGPGFVTIILWGMGFWTLINYVVAREVEGSWPRANRVVRWLSWVGGFSYSLYLVHRPFLVLWRKAELTLLEKLGIASLESQPWLLMVEWAASIFACLIAGRVFYFLIERHFLKPPPKLRRSAQPK